MILPQHALETLAAASAPALLVTPTETATAHLERIDGAPCLGGRGAARWRHDPCDRTLLRRAVQQGAQRIELPVELVTADRLVRIDTRADAERALAALSQGGFAEVAGRDALSAVLVPVGRRIVSALTLFEIKPDQLGWGAGLASIFGIAAASADWPRLALMLALAAEAALGLLGGCAQVMLRRGAPLWLQVLVKGASLAVLGVIGGRLGEGNALALAGAGLPLALIAAQSVADARDKPLVSAQPSPGKSGLWDALHHGHGAGRRLPRIAGRHDRRGIYSHRPVRFWDNSRPAACARRQENLGDFKCKWLVGGHGEQQGN